MRDNAMKNQLMISYIFAGLIFSANSYGRSGWYAGVDLGAGFASDADTSGSASDSPTNCDQMLDDANNRRLAPDNPGCMNNHSTWSNKAKFDTGVLLGANIGYAWKNLRVEGEYNYRQNSGSGYRDITFPGAKAPEFSSTVEAFDDLRGHQFFANLYYDFNNSSLWIPYVGAGLGFALIEMNYSNQFIRKSQPDFSVDNPLVNANAAGTASLVNGQALEDILFGYQFIAGLDYKLTENVFIGTKFRYAIFADFSGQGAFDLLRSHAPLRNDGSPLEYTIDTDDIDFWSVSLNLKYFF